MIKPIKDTEFLKRNHIPSNDEEAYSATVKVLESLSEEVKGARDLLRNRESDKINVLNFIIIYSYLREALDFTPNAPGIKELSTRFPELDDFIQYFEELNFNIELPSTELEGLFKISEKYKRELTTRFPLGSRVKPKREVSEDAKKVKLAEYGAWACFLLGLTLLNFTTDSSTEYYP